MNNKIKKYNQEKIAESLLKIQNRQYTNLDAVTDLINGIIDLSVKDEEERESTKATISASKDIAENIIKNNKRY